MDERTVRAYEGDEAAERFLQKRDAYRADRAETFATSVHGVRADIGSGPGLYSRLLGGPLVSLDASHALVSRGSSGMRVQADLEHLPFRRGALTGAWASRAHQHIPHEALPLALADLHRSIELDGRLALHVFLGDGTQQRRPDTDDFPGRLFSWWDRERLLATVEGAGFVIDTTEEDEHHIAIEATRARMLPDLVRPGLRVLFCGYNPSLYAADRGVAFARPGNRFWPAALEAGLVTRDRDPWHAVRAHDVGFTDLVKRASVAAAELTNDELRAGLDRVTRVCEWLAPDVVCFLGVGGWRNLVDRKATVGWQPTTIGPARVYVMPNPSGLNASTQHAGYVEHLRQLL
jgi:TDG/mug DNA glycosylase family protein